VAEIKADRERLKAAEVEATVATAAAARREKQPKAAANAARLAAIKAGVANSASAVASASALAKKFMAEIHAEGKPAQDRSTQPAIQAVQGQVAPAFPSTSFFVNGVLVGSLEIDTVETTVATTTSTVTRNENTGEVLSRVVVKTTEESFKQYNPPPNDRAVSGPGPARTARNRAPPPLDHGQPETLAEARARVARARAAREANPNASAAEKARHAKALQARRDDEEETEDDDDDGPAGEAGAGGGRVRLVVGSDGRASAQQAGSSSSSSAVEVPTVAWNAHVVAFDAPTFEQALETFDFVFVAFYAPW
jgi:hypothetical protein